MTLEVLILPQYLLRVKDDKFERKSDILESQVFSQSRNV
jgi:hypothetical protein